jgi:peroxiredoxin Q/BCP
LKSIIIATDRIEVFMLRAGEKAPNFRLRSDKGEEIALKDFKGKRVILFFFPRANTPG